MTSIPKGFLKNCQNMESFGAYGNNIISIPPETFESLKNLDSVNLGENDCINSYFYKHLEFIPSAFIYDNFRKLNHDIRKKCAPKDYHGDSLSSAIMECLLDFSFHKCTFSKVVEKIVYLF